MASRTLPELTQDLQRKVVDLQSMEGKEPLRQELLRLARSLVSQLETPRERIARMAYFDVALFPVTRVLVNLGVFKILDEASKSMNATQIAEECNADVRLLERLLKHVAVADFIQESGPDEYSANDVTRCLASAGGKGIMNDIGHVSRAMESLPRYFEGTGYSNPRHKDKSAWHELYRQRYFDYVFAPGHEDRVEAFHNHMKFKTLGLKWFEVPEIMDAAFGSHLDLTQDQALIIDVGGSTGHDLLEFEAAHPLLKGRKILQDLPASVDSLDKGFLSLHGIEAISHDFFTPQPISNAKVYYLKMVLHDWPAEQCRQILSNIRTAMKPGYSRILVNEMVIPETGARWMETGLDILMMAVHAAQERREREWMKLVEEVDGLQVNKIWLVEGAVETLIEIERVR